MRRSAVHSRKNPLLPACSLFLPFRAPSAPPAPRGVLRGVASLPNYPGETRFQAVTLEDLTSAVGAAGADTIAALVTERYLDFEPVHRAIRTGLLHTLSCWFQGTAAHGSGLWKFVT
jgi:hypothetical protein